MTYVILSFVLAYLIGAIPTSVWFGKIFYKKDVRQYGSGNAGATNTFRVLGAVAGIVVLVLDILKGVIAVELANILPRETLTTNQHLYYQIGLGIAAGIGHIFPVYLQFKGGKGVATLFGVVLCLFPWAALCSVVTFVVVFVLTRYVSLGSMIASVAFMISVFLLYAESIRQVPLVIFAIMVPVIIFYTHRKNIGRLISGTESKLSLSNKKPIS